MMLRLSLSPRPKILSRTISKWQQVPRGPISISLRQEESAMIQAKAVQNWMT